eukprot:TRINITY_DN18350_c0_g1_i1.p8 TRINITY_DN18350_c0_g1~~TRINITY_DN18350_c0_g1_i1.p8  ORF type:complete len:118 (-),score=27.22 TRINITY_DN18350_c0_g1_i1:1253-1606(-)
MGGGRIVIIKNKGEWTKALNEATETGKAVVVDFTAKWCGPCQMIAPKFEEFSELFDDVVFLKVDVDEVIDVASETGISAMPTFLIFQNGQKVDEVVGASEHKLKALIQKYSKPGQTA